MNPLTIHMLPSILLADLTLNEKSPTLMPTGPTFRLVAVVEVKLQEMHPMEKESENPAKALSNQRAIWPPLPHPLLQLPVFPLLFVELLWYLALTAVGKKTGWVMKFQDPPLLLQLL
jgi:hypothetical protein